MQYTAGDLKPCHTPWTVILGTFTQKQYKDIPKFKSLKNSLTEPLKRHKKRSLLELLFSAYPLPLTSNQKNITTKPIR